MPSRSQSGSKRSRLDDARRRLLKIFAGAPVERVFGPSAEERLRAAFELALDIEAFAKKYVPHYLVDQETGQHIDFAEFHRQIFRDLLVHLRLAIAAPREHAKSTIVSFLFVLYCMCYKLRRFIVVFSNTEPQAILQLAGVKAELESNDALRADFGDLVDDRKWGERDFVTSTDIRVSARGAGQSVRGLRHRMRRPDLAIYDDLEDDEAVESPERRQRLLQWIKRTALNLGKNCQHVFVGTILHFDSALAKLLSPEEFSNFTKRFYQAVDDDWSAASVLWPAKWPVAALKDKEADIGPVDFDQEFRNRPINAATQEFKEEWVKQHAYSEAEFRAKKIVRVLTAVDPGISRKKKTFGIATVAVDDQGYLYARTIEQKQMRFTEQVKYTLRRFDLDQPERLGVDTNAYQLALKDQLDEESRRSGRYIPVFEMDAKGEKLTRIAAIAPLVENGTLRFRLDGGHDTVLKQLYFLGKIATDAADALEMAVRLARGLALKGSLVCGDAPEAGETARDRFKGRVSRSEVGGQSEARSGYTQRCAECGEVVSAFRYAGEELVKVADCKHCAAPLPPRDLPPPQDAELPLGYERRRWVGGLR